MTVFLSNGQKGITEVFRQILDTFSEGMDYHRGVFIKPNIVFPVGPGSNEITSPAIVRALIAVLREYYSDIDIVLGEGVAAGCDPMENFQVSGYRDLADELGVPLIDLHSTERLTVPWKYGKLDLPKIAVERTYINLPVLKPSSACIISGALKNQKGLLKATMKKHFHRLGLHEPVAELNAIMKPALTIMDCSRYFGRNSFIAGNNCGEIDATACRLLGIGEPEHVQLSREAGVFTDGFTETGDKLKKSLLSARPELKEFKRIGKLRLWSNPQACTMCRYLFHDIQANLLKGKNLSVAAKLLPYTVKGAEVIIGSNPNWRKEYDTVICIGECTRAIAKEGDYIHVRGCPPDIEDLGNTIP